MNLVDCEQIFQRSWLKIPPKIILRVQRFISVREVAITQITPVKHLQASLLQASPLNLTTKEFVSGKLDSIGERQQLDILTAVQTRNIPRFLFLFLLSLMKNQFDSDERSSDQSNRSSDKGFLLNNLCNFVVDNKIRFDSGKISKIIRESIRVCTSFHTATLCIPYLFVTGMVLTCMQLCNAQNEVSSFTGEKATNFYFLTPVSNEVSDMREIRGLDKSVCRSLGSPGNSLQKISGFCFESLRITPICSKLFLLWALLQIWRGIRPGQSSLVDTQIQLRIVAPEENTKSLRGVQGIEKYHDILQGCVQSLRANSPELMKLRSLNFVGWLLTRFFKSAQAKLADLGMRPQHFLEHSSLLGGGLAPKAYLFLGPPGSGKTLCAQALAGEAKVPLLCLSASEIQKQIESGTKIGALRVRNLFQQTRAQTPCILFLDEIDSLSPSAKLTQATSSSQPNPLPTKLQTKLPTKLQSEHPEQRIKLQHNFYNNHLDLETKLQNRAEVANEVTNEVGIEQVSCADRTLLTEFLIQMDSFSIQDGFCIIGTTNFLDALDSAFIRSGRFDRLLALSLPGKKSRQALFELYSHPRREKNLKNWGSWFSPARRYSFQNPSLQNWNFWAEKTQGFSAADIAKIMNESFLHVLKESFNQARLQGPLDHTSESIQKGIHTIVLSPRALIDVK